MAGETSLELGIVEVGFRDDLHLLCHGQMTGAGPCNAEVGLYVAGSARRRGESGAELAGRRGGCRWKPTSTQAWQGLWFLVERGGGVGGIVFDRMLTTGVRRFFLSDVITEAGRLVSGDDNI